VRSLRWNDSADVREEDNDFGFMVHVVFEVPCNNGLAGSWKGGL
jgi:hypothetical protein